MNPGLAISHVPTFRMEDLTLEQLRTAFRNQQQTILKLQGVLRGLRTELSQTSALHVSRILSGHDE